LDLEKIYFFFVVTNDFLYVCHLNFFFVPGKCNLAQELAGERPMAFLRMPLLLLHARMLHVAGHLFIEEGNLNLFLI
jgi:hypothetical protein